MTILLCIKCQIKFANCYREVMVASVNLKNKPSKKFCAGCIGKSDENEKKGHLQMKRYS